MGKPKLSRRFNGLQSESVRIDRELSDSCDQIFEDIKKRVAELERSKRQLEVVRATLLVNFGPNGLAGVKAGVIVNDANNRSTLELLLTVLEQLCNKVETSKRKGVERVHSGR